MFILVLSAGTPSAELPYGLVREDPDLRSVGDRGEPKASGLSEKGIQTSGLSETETP